MHRLYTSIPTVRYGRPMGWRVCSSSRKLHFAPLGTHCRVKTQEVVEGVPVKTEAGWTERMRQDTTAAPHTDHCNAVRPHACSPLAGLERLQAELCRALGRVHPCPSALPAVLLPWPGGQEARVWHPGQ